MSGWKNPLAHYAGGGRLAEVQTFCGLRVVVLEGDGTEADVSRLVTHYFDEDGKRIAVHDPCEHTQGDEGWRVPDDGVPPAAAGGLE